MRAALSSLASLALFLALLPAPAQAQPASGHARRENVLLGMHFLHSSLDCNAKTRGIEDIVPTFWDYVRYMPEDLEHMSYADFWHWWYEFERYKGDEKGLEAMDAIVDGCLERGMKVKIDLSWSTWWTEDLDWETGPRLAYGPPDLDDWAHLVEVVGRRYRGRVAVWHPQGEANDLKGYWRGRPIEHVHEVYRIALDGLKAADPRALVSVAGASPSVSREALDAWVESNVKALQGRFDDVPMNFFADIADPYGGLVPYFTSIRRILDANGCAEAEVGSGESSFQWAESSDRLPVQPPRTLDGRDPAKLPFCELKQAWTFNESLASFFDLGGNKFILWGTEYAPGGGWTWRWGFRKYQDWWGTWPDSHKIPGTNIVYRFDPAGGVPIDLRSGWSSRETDPFHPIWELYKFWAQATPPGAEAVRIPSGLQSAGAPLRHLATYLQARDSLVALLDGEAPAGTRLRLDIRRTGWQEGASLQGDVACDSIELGTGIRTRGPSRSLAATVTDGSVALSLPALSGLTTVRLSADPLRPLDARPVFQRLVGRAEVGEALEWLVTVRNTGRREWAPGEALVGLVDEVAGPIFPIGQRVQPGGTASVAVTLPPPLAAGRVAVPLRLRTAPGEWFGPLFNAVASVSDSSRPRKLVAHRGEERVLVQWLTGRRPSSGDEYELFRAEGRGAPATLVARVSGTEYVDRDVKADVAYYYHVRGPLPVSAASNVDNAKALSRRRLFDADILEHTVPRTLVLGDLVQARVTLKNTGTRPWDLGRSRFTWKATRLWGENDEEKLPQVALGRTGVVAPGESVTLSVPMAGPRIGTFENHWILTLDAPGKDRAYFGMPLIIETTVQGNS